MSKIQIKIHEDTSGWDYEDENDEIMFISIAEQDDDEIARGSGTVFTASNGIVISSDSTPEWVAEENILHIQGEDTDDDDDQIEVLPADLPRILQAVREFNLGAKTGGDARLKAFTAELKALADRYAK